MATMHWHILPIVASQNRPPGVQRQLDAQVLGVRLVEHSHSRLPVCCTEWMPRGAGAQSVFSIQQSTAARNEKAHSTRVLTCAASVRVSPSDTQTLLSSSPDSLYASPSSLCDRWQHASSQPARLRFRVLPWSATSSGRFSRSHRTPRYGGDKVFRTLPPGAIQRLLLNTTRRIRTRACPRVSDTNIA